LKNQPQSLTFHSNKGYNITSLITFTYGAITPRTSEDFVKPHEFSHPSSSSESCLDEKNKLTKTQKY
jgi:hypothetical protein